MKKIISMITCLMILTCMLVVPEPIEVHAAETENSKVYYIDFLQSTFGSGKTYDGYVGHMEFMVNGDIVMYCTSTANHISVKCIILNEDGTINNCYSSLINISNAVINRKNYKYIKANYTFKGGFDYDINEIYKQADGVIAGDLDWVTSTIEESGFLRTNIPIFKDEVTAKEYLQGNVSIEDAINYESDLTDIIYDLEVPQDMKLTCDDGMFSLPIYTMKWKQNDPNYQNWTTEVYIYVSMDAWEGALGIHLWGDSYTYEDMYLMGESFSTYKLKYVIDVDSDKYEKAEEAILDYIFNDNPKLSGSAVDYYKVYMRNYYNDGTYRHYSNWLLIEFDYEFESGQGVTSVIEMNGSVKDNPGATKPELDFVGDIVGDSQYTGEIDGNLEESSGDILSWIKNGFGIGGDSGVIAMISDTFDFIPPEMWAVMMSGIALMVGVAVFKFIRG